MKRTKEMRCPKLQTPRGVGSFYRACCIKPRARATSIILVVSIVLQLVNGVTVVRAADERGEYDIKMAFLVNFARFTEWPNEAFTGPNTPLVLGIYGGNPFDGTKAVNGRRLEVRRIGDLKDIAGCHLLFIDRDHEKNLASVMIAIKNKPVLTVGEGDKFGPAGGMIRFFIDDTQVRFEINLQEVQRANLKISAKLLGVAKVIRETPGP
jgi:hypothetical protein